MDRLAFLRENNILREEIDLAISMDVRLAPLFKYGKLVDFLDSLSLASRKVLSVIIYKIIIDQTYDSFRINIGEEEVNNYNVGKIPPIPPVIDELINANKETLNLEESYEKEVWDLLIKFAEISKIVNLVSKKIESSSALQSNSTDGKPVVNKDFLRESEAVLLEIFIDLIRENLEKLGIEDRTYLYNEEHARVYTLESLIEMRDNLRLPIFILEGLNAEPKNRYSVQGIDVYLLN